MSFRNHRIVLTAFCALAAVVVMVAVIGCSPPKDPTAQTKGKLEGDLPAYLSDEAAPYDKDRLQSIKNARGTGASDAARYAVTLTFADVKIPEGLDTIDPGQFETPPSNVANPAVILDLASGKRIVFELYADKCPGTVKHFIPIVESGFYSGVYFQRSDEMCIQGGDPAVNQKEPWPRTVELEISGEPFDAGSVGMARTSEPNSGSSQFFIAKARATHLDTGYANFGMVLEGMDAVMAVPSRDQANTSAPLDEESRIVKARLVRFEGYETAQQELLKQLQEAQTEESSDDTESEGGNVATDSESGV